MSLVFFMERSIGSTHILNLIKEQWKNLNNKSKVIIGLTKSNHLSIPLL